MNQNSEKIVSSIQIETEKQARERKQLFLLSLISVVFCLAIWELAVKLEWLNSKYI